METKAQEKSGKAQLPKPLFPFPEKQAHLEKSNNGGVRVAFKPSPRLLKYEEREMLGQARACVGWIRGLGLSASQLGVVDDHVQGVRR